jgi:hypothetical protein
MFDVVMPRDDFAFRLSKFEKSAVDRPSGLNSVLHVVDWGHHIPMNRISESGMQFMCRADKARGSLTLRGNLVRGACKYPSSPVEGIAVFKWLLCALWSSCGFKSRNTRLRSHPFAAFESVSQGQREPNHWAVAKLWTRSTSLGINP